MRALVLNKTMYLGVSFVLLLVSLPLISAGTTAGASAEVPAGASGPGAGLLWAGLVCLAVGIVLLPIQRLLTGTDDEDPDSPDDD
ncbi:hypothetical protein [Brevibacterium yomogidense]|uniref:hypothetical protein n=1 Tax=Brevibacterium yomogidense TaxID=946573 RepID=UPI0018E003A3|nr:hypothetical protein [Brevibacterium yomogidense]